MVLGNKLQLTSQVELNRAEERLSKQKAKQLFGEVELPAGEFNKPQAIAMSIHTNTLSTTKEIFLRNEIDFVEFKDRLVVKPKFAGNTILEFVSHF